MSKICEENSWHWVKNATNWEKTKPLPVTRSLCCRKTFYVLIWSGKGFFFRLGVNPRLLRCKFCLNYDGLTQIVYMNSNICFTIYIQKVGMSSRELSNSDQPSDEHRKTGIVSGKFWNRSVSPRQFAEGALRPQRIDKWRVDTTVIHSSAMPLQ